MMVKIPFPQASNMIAENADIKNKTPQKKYVIKYVEKMRVLAFLIIMFQANITAASSEINKM